MERIAVEQDRVDAHPCAFDGRDRTRERRLEAGGYAELVDIVRTDEFDVPCDGGGADDGGKLRARGRRELLRVIDAFDAGLVGKDDGADGERTCQRTCLLYTSDAADD